MNYYQYRLIEFDLDGRKEVVGLSAVNYGEQINPKVVILPNPVQQDKIYLSSPDDIDLTGAEISIYTSSGQLELQQKLRNSSEVNVASLIPGVYFLVLTDDEIQTTERLVVTKKAQ